MPERVSAKTRRRRLARSLSVQQWKTDQVAITERREAVLLTREVMIAARYGPRSTFGSVTPNSMQSRMPHESAFLWKVARCMSPTRRAWTALVRLYRQAFGGL